MAFIKLPRDAFDTFTVTARPSRTFISSSSGVTGSVRVYQRSSDSEKEISPYRDDFAEDSIELIHDELRKSASGSTNYSALAEEYMTAVNSAARSPRRLKEVQVLRFEPSFQFTGDTLRKSVVRNVLYPYYRTTYPDLNWGFTNYLSLHFPDGVGPSNAALIYPSTGSAYYPSSSFSFETYLKPSYTAASGSDFKAGTILHASSSYCLSLATGSLRDSYGRPSSYRLILQLSHSADVSPSLVNLTAQNGSRAAPQDLVFVSEDEKILFNNWHHVVARWSPTADGSTGSFYIDGVKSGEFVVPYYSVTTGTVGEALFVGNYFESPRTVSNRPAGFFNEDAVENEGVTDDFDAVGNSLVQPSNFNLTHPFRGEIHETRVWDSYRNTDEIVSGSREGSEITDDLLFYLPPFFVKEGPRRKVLQSPFQSYLSETDDPFNVALSFGVGGHLINLENHVREFVRGVYPRLLHLTGTTIESQTLENLEANGYLYATGSIVRRNLTILPNDNGKFYPNFTLVESGSSYSSGSSNEKFVNDYGAPDLRVVNLSKLVPTSSLFPGLIQDGDLLDEVMGASPENPGVAPGSVLTIFQRTRDTSSNMVTFFDASNLFYGGRLHPGSFTLTDPGLTGSAGTMSVTLRDNGRGGLYRADASSSHATWSPVGSVLYPEGLATVTSPYYGELFGKDAFSVEFKGEQEVHVLEMQAIAPAWTLNTSSNPTYKPLYSSDYANDKDKGFVFINTLNFHDENLNVVARANLSQPIVKRPGDRIMFRVKFDF